METETKDRGKTKSCLRWAAVLLLAALVMAFFFGMLPAFPLAVATGSMEPAIEIGDAVVIGRTDRNASRGTGNCLPAGRPDRGAPHYRADRNGPWPGIPHQGRS